MDIRVEILDKYEQSTVNTGPNSAEIFSIHGGAYLQIIGVYADKRPKPGKKPRNPLKSWESSIAFWGNTFRAADKDG